ncbi:la-related protein 7 isoform X2 [Bacillus rossius redtenbacheri]|uniref:la-related protein 7 isoform X2 n=1 Tax=Bacillus rossius redtenbacheri TaxID=93214 RepID=UPI002FDD6C68
MCENMEDQSGPKVDDDEAEAEGIESAEIMESNEHSLNMEASALMAQMAEEENQKKRTRHRRRKIYENIRSKMEFYFSDANLAKDRFLHNLIENNPEVDLGIFLRFNKIRELTDNIKDIKKALKHSEVLSVSEDGTRVFRISPLQKKENEDECTIYVVFSQYGTVDYVSIPKYWSTGKIKGFAFVEFHTPQEAQKTLEVFGAVGCCLPSNIEPEKLCSIAAFEKEESGDRSQQSGDNLASRKQKRAHGEGGDGGKVNEEGDAEVVTLEEQDAESEKSPAAKKREKHKDKASDKESSRKEEKKRKRKRKNTDGADEVVEIVQDSLEDNNKKDKKKKKMVEITLDVEEEVDLTGDNEKKGKSNPKHLEVTIDSDVEAEEISCKDENKRKRKHSETTKSVDVEEDQPSESKKKKQIDVVDLEKSSPDTESPNKRKLQEEVVTVEEDDVPEKIAKTDSDPEREEDDAGTENYSAEDGIHKKKKSRHRKKKKRKQIAHEVSALGLQVLSKMEWKRLRNKYLNLQRKTMKNLKQQLFRTRMWDQRGSHANGHPRREEQAGEAPSSEVSQGTPRFSYTPGVIVRVSLEAPVKGVSKFKAEARSLGDVQYVDVEEGATEAFLRCSTAEGAAQLVTSKPWEQMAVLEGEEDKQYWNRILEWRQKMAHSDRKKKRGKDKLLARAEKVLSKHIKFDDNV